MINFIKSRKWDDWIIIIMVGCIIIGFALFIIGFFWGFGYDSLIDINQKTNVNKILKEKENSLFNAYAASLGYNLDFENIFTLMSSIDAQIGILFSMIIISIIGFSIIMLGLLMFIIVIITLLSAEYIIPKIKKIYSRGKVKN